MATACYASRTAICKGRVAGGRAVIPRGGVTLTRGDKLIVIAVPAAHDAVLRRLTGLASGPRSP